MLASLVDHGFNLSALSLIFIQMTRILSRGFESFISLQDDFHNIPIGHRNFTTHCSLVFVN